MTAAAWRGHEGLAELVAAATLQAGAAAVFASSRAPSQAALPALPLGPGTNVLQLFHLSVCSRGRALHFSVSSWGCCCRRGDVHLCLFLGTVGDGSSREAPGKEQGAQVGSGGSGV